MDLEILSTEKMAQTGETLSLLMGDVILPFDLLIRESIQNSLDAARCKEKNEHVTVEFVTGEFNSDEFCKHLDCQVSDTILQEFGGGPQRFLSIRDSGTTGLTGKSTDSDSNLSKLIYQVFQRQQAKGSGGSCGVGKTTYFRMGRGIVFYYSAIRTSNGQELRLAGIIVEDPRYKRIIKARDSRGIAFFGKYQNDSTKTEPITDSVQIAEFLKLFNIAPYGCNEYGTTIIIPYFEEGSLLERCTPTTNGGQKPSWCSSTDRYITTAVQRWYFARLNNPEYDGTWLRVFVNGKGLAKDAMHPLFTLFQVMYNCFDGRIPGDVSIKVEDIRKKVVEGSLVGKLIWCLVDPKDYNLYADKYADACSLVGNHSSTGNSIITFMRKPAMAIRYECGSNSWMPATTFASEGKILLALFRINSNANLSQSTINKIQSKGRKDIFTLEDYIRACEREDHNDWVDLSGLDIVQKIKEGISSKLSEAINAGAVSNNARTQHSVSAMLTRAFLPSPDIYENSTEQKSRKGASHGRSSGSIEISGVEYDKKIIRVMFRLISCDGENTSIKIAAHGEVGIYTPDSWVEEIGVIFPYSIKSVTINTIAKKKRCIMDHPVSLNEKKITRLVDGVGATYNDYSLNVYSQEKTIVEGMIEIYCESAIVPLDLKIEGFE